MFICLRPPNNRIRFRHRPNVSTGAITDLEGKYTLTVNDPKAEIVFSYIGYKQQVLPAKESILNVTMSEDTQMISEVVVTALGIKREKKMLGYAVQEIKGDQLPVTV